MQLDNPAQVSAENAIQRTPKPRSPAPSADLSGKRVCFTGTLICSRSGVLISRETAVALAEAMGLEVRDRVTKDLDVLVVADPYTQSGKAETARRYGTRIVAERVFWRMLGVDVD